MLWWKGKQIWLVGQRWRVYRVRSCRCGAVVMGTSAGAGPVSFGLLARLVLLLTCKWDEEQITHYQISHWWGVLHHTKVTKLRKTGEKKEFCDRASTSRKNTQIYWQTQIHMRELGSWWSDDTASHTHHWCGLLVNVRQIAV